MKLRLILTLILLVPVMIGNAQTSKKTVKTDKIEAYYFHFTARCMTCKTVEAQAKQDLETLYPDQVKKGKITFQSLNLDDASSNAIAQKLQVSGQTLLLVKGGQKTNITNEGFMYAVSQPQKFKEIIKKKVDGLLKL